MQKKYVSRVSWCLLLLLIGVLSGCMERVGTIPQGTPDTGNGTPSVMMTPSPTPLKVPQAPANTVGKNYAFVREQQLWVAMQGGAPTQITNFDFAQTPNVFWTAPQWSAGDNYLAFRVNAVASGLGGGGCPGPDYSANAALFIYETKSKQFTQLTLPGIKRNVQASGQINQDYWHDVFWEDASHLLAWYNGPVGEANAEAGLYRYDLAARKLSQIVPLSKLGNVAVLSNPRQGVPLVTSMRYSNGQLFYQLVERPFEQQSQMKIFQYGLKQAGAKSRKILDVGSFSWCATQQRAAYVTPGWDVSANGEQLVAQVIVAQDIQQGVSAIKAVSIQGDVTTELFTQIDAKLLARDVTLAWAPDNLTVVASGLEAESNTGPYTASLTDPGATQSYAPSLKGRVSWRRDGTAFALQNIEAVDKETKPNVYVFFTEDTKGRLLLEDAQKFVWG